MPISANVRASLYMVLSMSGFTINDLFIKSLDGNLPRGFKTNCRTLYPDGSTTVCRRSRCNFIVSHSACHPTFFYYFCHIAGIAIGSGSGWRLNTKRDYIGWRRWIAILVGFVGVLIIIRPGVDSFEPASILMIFSVLFAAGRDLATRCLPKDLPSLLVSLATAVSICVVGAALSTVQNNWQPMSSTQTGTLFIVSISGAGYAYR